MARKLIVTHHAPDLDAITSTWLLKRFGGNEFATAKVAFVNPGENITLEQAEQLGCQLHEVTHVDTGLGEFDHHQPDRGLQFISATSLVYDYLCQKYPDYKDDQALAVIAEFTTSIDHFGEIHWPEASHSRYNFMIHELINGSEYLELNDDEAQLNFGFMCLERAYAGLTVNLKAEIIVKNEGIVFETKVGKGLALETSNDDTIKLAQKQGYVVVIRKDPKVGNIRIKARPDAPFNLDRVRDLVLQKDTKGHWYYHPSGKMLINGSSKHRNQTPSTLTLAESMELVQKALNE